MENFQQVVADRTHRAGVEFVFNVRRIPEDKATWRPMDEGESPLGMAIHVIDATGRWKRSIGSGIFQTPDQSVVGKLIQEIETLEQAATRLEHDHAALVETIRNFPSARLDDPFSAPWRTAPMSEWLMHPFFHLSYHQGQLAYIQTLIGDHEMARPK